MKLAIVVGHTNSAKGAYATSRNVHEYTWNKALAEKILEARGKHDIKIFFRDGIGIAGAYQSADDWGANATIELHFNASHHDTSSGSGVLYAPGSAKGKLLAKSLQNELQGFTKLKSWPEGTDGVVTPFQASGKQQRGLTSLTSGRAPAALVEPFFGSCPSDCNAAMVDLSSLAKTYVNAINNYQNL